MTNANGAVLVAIVVLTGLTAVLLRERTLKAPITVVNVGGLAVLFYLGLSFVDDTNTQRSYDTCVARVERSAGNRLYNLRLIDVIEREVPDRPDIGTELRASLDEFLPVLELSDC